MECLRLRVMNLDFLHRSINVHNGKGGKDREVTLSDELIVPLQRHLTNRQQTHDKAWTSEQCKNQGGQVLPFAYLFPYQYRLVAALKYMARSFVDTIEALGVNAIELAHSQR